MFKLEFMELANKYKLEEQKYEKEKIFGSIKKLVLENKYEAENFLTSSNLSVEVSEILEKSILDAKYEEKQKKNESLSSDFNSDISKVKDSYLLWRKSFEENSCEISEKCLEVVDEIVSFYTKQRFSVLDKLFEIYDDEIFEIFKTHVMNSLRKFYAQKVLSIQGSPKFLSLGFFEKRRRNKKLLEVLREMNNYKFDFEKIQRVIKK